MIPFMFGCRMMCLRLTLPAAFSRWFGEADRSMCAVRAFQRGGADFGWFCTGAGSAADADAGRLHRISEILLFYVHAKSGVCMCVMPRTWVLLLSSLSWSITSLQHAACSCSCALQRCALPHPFLGNHLSCSAALVERSMRLLRFASKLSIGSGDGWEGCGCRWCGEEGCGDGRLEDAGWVARQPGRYTGRQESPLRNAPRGAVEYETCVQLQHCMCMYVQIALLRGPGALRSRRFALLVLWARAHKWRARRSCSPRRCRAKLCYPFLCWLMHFNLCVCRTGCLP